MRRRLKHKDNSDWVKNTPGITKDKEYLNHKFQEITISY